MLPRIGGDLIVPALIALALLAAVAADDFFPTLRTTASFTGNILANDSDPDPGDAIDGITGVGTADPPV